MSMTEARGVQTRTRGFRHEALLYAGQRQFLDGTVPFLQEGLAQDEPALVVVDAGKIAALRQALGADADRVHFADMNQVGRNPARIIPRWHEFVDKHLRPDRPIRGIGEPIWAGRSPAELIECQAHEALLNVAFADGPAWSLLCPYDVDALEAAVVAEAHRSHPFVAHNGARQPSHDYRDALSSPTRLDHPLPPAPTAAEPVPFGPDPDALQLVRTIVLRHTQEAGLDPLTAGDLVVAVNEVATNTLCHGGGRGTVRLWREGDALICQVDDAGHISGQPLVGRQTPTLDQLGGRGLWLANQLCDLVQIRSTPAGTSVRLRITAAGA